MTEEQARKLVGSIVSAAALERLDLLATIVREENEKQNLIGRSTVPQIWRRHILDSIQLLTMAPQDAGQWLDIGTGGGFPGLAIACAVDHAISLVEPRALRAMFLRRAIERLELGNADVRQEKVQSTMISAGVISARAVASPQRLLQQARNCATATTRWLFPVGNWDDKHTQMISDVFPSMMFHVEQSRSDATSTVLVGSGRPG